MPSADFIAKKKNSMCDIGKAQSEHCHSLHLDIEVIILMSILTPIQYALFRSDETIICKISISMGVYTQPSLQRVVT